MTRQTQSGAVDLETTSLANLAEIFAKRIADALDDTVRRIVREELDQVARQGKAGS